MLDKVSEYIKNNNYKVSIIPTGLYVYNYKVIIDITSTLILFKTSNKLFKIKGKNMILKKMDKCELLISGTIESVECYE